MLISRVLGIFGAFGLVAGMIGITVSAAGATSCSGPQLSVSPSTVAPGTTTLLSGYGFGKACTSSGLGPPARDVEIVVRVGDREKAVGRVDVGADYDFVIHVHIPPSLGTGSGAITARSEELPIPVDVPIEVTGSEGDHGDRPYLEWDGTGPDPGIPWTWIGTGAIGGAVVAVAVGTAARREPR